VALCSLIRRFQVILLHGVVAKLRDADAVAANQLQREALAREALVAVLAVEELV